MTRQRPSTRILIVDDHPLVREGIAMRIGMYPDLQVCGEAATEDEAFTMVQQISPDLMIIDISLKSGHGLELIKRIKSLHLDVRMLVVSGFQESLYAERVLRAGALGYLSKQESNAKLIDAIRAVLKGQRYVSAEITQRLLERALGNQDMKRPPIEQLTDRELEIFRLIGQGWTSGLIADQLFLSTHTIDTHRENIKRKLACKNAGELNRQAIQWLLEND
ncbi:response regulator [Gimesia sp.]|uniref:response regulator n=1 Tax=Gimesia sp. TaxID=2024833 RepID=UPI003A9351D0